MKKVFYFLRNYKKQAVLAPTFKMIEAFLDLLVPLVVANIIDVGIAQNDMPYIYRWFGVMILLAAVSLVISFTAQYFAANASVGMATEMRQSLFDKIQSFSYTDLDRVGTDTLITRLTSDINQVQTGVNMALRLLLRSPLIVVGSMIMAFTIDFRCALVFAVAVPALGVVIFLIMRFSIPIYRKVQKALDKVLGLTRENLTGVRVIRAFRKEDDEVADFDDANQELTRINLFVGRISALLNPATYILVNIATIVLIQQGALQVNLGAIQQGDVVALYNYMAQMIVELIKLASMIATVNRTAACADRVEAVLNIEPEMQYPVKSPVSKSTGEVRFEGVSLTYQSGGAPALTNIDFTAFPGETIGIIGGTGSGKSSLVNLMPRFYDATSGRVVVDGADVKAYPKEELVGKFGIVPQKAVLFEGTIRDNLKWGNPDASDEDLKQAVKIAQAEDIVDKKSGLDAHIEQNGRNLSGGQLARLTIARALVRKPEILILDDSARALDFATDARLRKAIHGLGGMTVFIVSQRASAVRDADRILVLDDGTLAGSGTHRELMENCEVYREIYYSQFPEENPENVGKNYFPGNEAAR